MRSSRKQCLLLFHSCVRKKTKETTLPRRIVVLIANDWQRAGKNKRSTVNTICYFVFFVVVVIGFWTSRTFLTRSTVEIFPNEWHEIFIIQLSIFDIDLSFFLSGPVRLFVERDSCVKTNARQHQSNRFFSWLLCSVVLGRIVSHSFLLLFLIEFKHWTL